MGSRNSRRANTGLDDYGYGYDPNAGLDYYGGSYDPYAIGGMTDELLHQVR